MSELGSGNGTSYPTALDINESLEVNAPNIGKTKARAEVVNDLSSAIVAIESTLGTSPAGTVANVKTFLQTQHNTNGTHKNVTTNTLLATGQITSTLADGTAPLVITSTTKVANLNADTLRGYVINQDLETTDSPQFISVSAIYMTSSSFVGHLTGDASGSSSSCTGNSATATTSLKLTDGTNLIHLKVIDLGTWNMDSTNSIIVAHGITSLLKIKGIQVSITRDSDVSPQTLWIDTKGGFDYITADSTDITIVRSIGGPYDSTDYDSITQSRGSIIITYVD